jgi:adenine deaminase
MTDLQRRLAVARGDEPADLVVRGGRVLSVFTREWLEADVAIVDGAVAGLGAYAGGETIDAAGRYVVPGFIDAHMHLESVKLLVDEFARLVLPLGTTAVVADPHEIANVLGSDGVHWLHDASAGLQLEVFFMAPSCVPASRFESPRRPLEPGDLEALMRRNRVLGLAEMMNFPGVIAGDAGELEKLALEGAEHVDGHAPGVLGAELQAYAAAGIRSDHEMLTVEEGRQRLRAGMWLLVREASMARNLRALLPLVAEYGPGRIAFCTDDRDPEDIVDNGHVNGMVRDAVAAGIDPADAILMASFHPAQWHRLRRHGAVAPGYLADLLVLPDLERFVPDIVLKRGRPIDDVPGAEVPEWVRQTVRVRPVAATKRVIATTCRSRCARRAARARRQRKLSRNRTRGRSKRSTSHHRAAGPCWSTDSAPKTFRRRAVVFAPRTSSRRCAREGQGRATARRHGMKNAKKSKFRRKHRRKRLRRRKIRWKNSSR